MSVLGRVFLSGAVFLTILSGLSTFSMLAGAEITGTASVISGDSMEINGVRVKLKGIMAPVAGQTCEVFGRQYDCRRISATALMDLTAGALIRCEEHQADLRLGVIATCYAGDYDLSEGMVYTGWALAFPRASNKYSAFEERARRSRHGLWRGKFVPPWDWAMKDRSN